MHLGKIPGQCGPMSSDLACLLKTLWPKERMEETLGAQVSDYGFGSGK